MQITAVTRAPAKAQQRNVQVRVNKRALTERVQQVHTAIGIQRPHRCAALIDNQIAQRERVVACIQTDMAQSRQIQVTFGNRLKGRIDKMTIRSIIQQVGGSHFRLCTCCQT